MEGLKQYLFIVCLLIGTQCFHTTSQIADAHGAGKSIAVDLSESLYLHGTGKGHQCVGNQIHIIWHKSNNKQ